MKITIQLSFLLISSLFIISFNPETHTPTIEKEPKNQAAAWADSVFNTMSWEEKMGQLMSLRAYSNKGEKHVKEIENMITKYHIGGLTFFQGTPEKQAELTNRYQKLTKRVPLMIAVDAEWGLGMRFKEHAISFPQQLMLGAIQDNRLLYDMGQEVAWQCQRQGIHFNFAPVVDVNNNPDNPVINTRSFGEDRYNVAAKSYMYAKGMEDHGIIACAKHFPGHGDTDVDSHYDLPIISHDEKRLDSIELFPFQILVDQKIKSIMVAHLNVPSIDSTPNFPTTLSRNAVMDLLKKEMGFEGLAITDALDMKGVTKHHKTGEVEAKALVAGNDILLLPGDLGTAYKVIKEYMDAGTLDSLAVFESVKKILRAKYELGLTKFEPIELKNIRTDLNHNRAKALKRKLIENALTLVRNQNDFLPFRQIDTLQLASLAIGVKTKTTFQKTLGLYQNMTHLTVGKDISNTKNKDLVRQLKTKDAVIVSIHDMSIYTSKDFGLTSSLKKLVKDLQKETKVILVVFGSPYSLKYFDEIDWLLDAYEENEDVQDLAAQALFGAFSIRGRLPVTASPKSAFGMGVTTQSLFRLSYGLPEEVGLDSDTLRYIDTLAQLMIEKEAAPGGVVLVAKAGKVVFQKAYGYHTYSEKQPTTTADIFDLASVTKICATTLSTMKLHEEGKINIFAPIETYLPELANTNKKGVILRDMLTHHAGLKPWIPFYLETINSKKQPSSQFYKKKKGGEFTIRVAENLFMHKDYMDSIWHKIADSKLRTLKNYKYSDLGLILTGKLIQQISQQGVDNYAAKHFYQPLGLQSMTYNPLEKHAKSSIPPTELDRYWRHQRLQGHVHDMAAAMLDGVAGHAGLFSNANDLAVVMQLLLNKGYYGGEQYLQSETVKLFTTRCPNCTRRGIGFDMKQLDSEVTLNMSEKASDRTFGHLGFTGIATWADPEHDIVFIFLSNRTYPTMHNNKLGKMDIRPKMQEVIYRAMK